MDTETKPRKEYECSCCGETFEEGWSEEEAQAEFKENFGSAVSDIPTAVVCDDCYNTIMGVNIPIVSEKSGPL